MKKVFVLLFLSYNVICVGQQNRKNKFDDIGRQHNQILFDLINSNTLKMAKTSNIKDPYKIYLKFLDECCERKMSCCGSPGPTKPINEEIILFHKALTPKTTFLEVFRQNYTIPNPGRSPLEDWFWKLWELYRTKKLEKAATNNDFNEIIAIEDMIISDKKISSNDKEYLLKTTSIMRYSYKFWSDVKFNPKNPYFNPNLKQFPWGSDVDGAIGGYRLGGGWGALGGAAFCSGVELIKDYFFN
ncbi:hypothetical protein [Runella salmonicolor]|uniref:Uncharacterized protein n=1 Tax=Runella salmonicolor TaxID=2950278 RepID=A0ABT1FSI6_9BACT|nr:hypothetical protein [Runella salmonicolor]MCP1384724.1 hypothetical protein [Runella salmonicolor]